MLNILIHLIFLGALYLLYKNKDSISFNAKPLAVIVGGIYIWVIIFNLAIWIEQIKLRENRIYSVDLGREITTTNVVNLESVLVNNSYVVLAICFIISYFTINFFLTKNSIMRYIQIIYSALGLNVNAILKINQDNNLFTIVKINLILVLFN